MVFQGVVSFSQSLLAGEPETETSTVWQARRRHFRIRSKGACPVPLDPSLTISSRFSLFLAGNQITVFTAEATTFIRS
ncbi:hypothetical protein L1987_21724 [Smallanthus sonchifolius]|uniref:Uncharacterized protein n=1 Tax=Smallanthus sonchifolius TaxID=185202 RepID=A0ACB9ICM8_9ASTR|nr:hypothetical protein L1987_21724 [Smallanthus sonchifolius]